MGGSVCPKNFFFCDGGCRSSTQVAICDGHRDCQDGTDEMYCDVNNVKVYRDSSSHVPTYTPPSADVVTTTVIPTIVGCILLVIAMLVGIQKCKQWELDRIMEMRRTRRVVQRITQRLREKNMKTLEHMRALRKRRAALVAAARADAEQTRGALDVINELSTEPIAALADAATSSAARSGATSADPLVEGASRRLLEAAAPPPAYYTQWNSTGTSPPPPYDDADALLDHYYFELFCRQDDETTTRPAFLGPPARRGSSLSSASSSASLASAVAGIAGGSGGIRRSGTHSSLGSGRLPGPSGLSGSTGSSSGGSGSNIVPPPVGRLTNNNYKRINAVVSQSARRSTTGRRPLPPVATSAGGSVSARGPPPGRSLSAQTIAGAAAAPRPPANPVPPVRLSNETAAGHTIGSILSI